MVFPILHELPCPVWTRPGERTGETEAHACPSCRKLFQSRFLSLLQLMWGRDIQPCPPPPEHLDPALFKPNSLLLKQLRFGCGTAWQRRAQVLPKSLSICLSQTSPTRAGPFVQAIKPSLGQRYFPSDGFHSLSYFPACWVSHPSTPLHLATKGWLDQSRPIQNRPQNLCKGPQGGEKTSLLTSRGWMGPARFSPRTAV